MLRESGNEKTNDFKNDKNENVQMMRKYQPQMNLVWIRTGGESNPYAELLNKERLDRPDYNFDYIK